MCNLKWRCSTNAEACTHVRQAYADYHDMMALTEDLVRTCAADIAGGLRLTYQGLELDFGPPFRRATMHELVQEATGARLCRSWPRWGRFWFLQGSCMALDAQALCA